MIRRPGRLAEHGHRLRVAALRRLGRRTRDRQLLQLPPLRPLNGTAASICPLYFWGLGKVIERPVHGERPVTGGLLRTDPGPDRRRLPTPR